MVQEIFKPPTRDMTKAERIAQLQAAQEHIQKQISELLMAEQKLKPSEAEMEPTEAVVLTDRSSDVKPEPTAEASPGRRFE